MIIPFPHLALMAYGLCFICWNYTVLIRMAMAVGTTTTGLSLLSLLKWL